MKKFLFVSLCAVFFSTMALAAPSRVSVQGNHFVTADGQDVDLAILTPPLACARGVEQRIRHSCACHFQVGGDIADPHFGHLCYFVIDGAVGRGAAVGTADVEQLAGNSVGEDCTEYFHHH